MFKRTLEIATSGQRCYDITAPVQQLVDQSGIADGVVALFVKHTTASLAIQENYDPDVQHDLIEFFRRIVPEDHTLYRHRDEGPDDMPSHIRTLLSHTSELIPLDAGRLGLGRWQAIYLIEHRHQPHRRQIDVRVIGA